MYEELSSEPEKPFVLFHALAILHLFETLSQNNTPIGDIGLCRSTITLWAISDQISTSTPSSRWRLRSSNEGASRSKPRVACTMKS